MTIETFLSYLSQEKKYSPHTITSYKVDLLQYQQYLQETFEADILDSTHVLVRDYMVHLLDNQIGATSVGRKLSSLRSFFKYQQRQGKLSANPMAQIKAPKVSKPLPVFIEDQKMDELLDSTNFFDNSFASVRDKLTIELLFGTGMRLAELLFLTEADVDFYKGTLKVLGKGAKQRIIPLPKPLVNQLQAYVNLKAAQNFGNKSGRLIVTNTGGDAYPKFIYHMVKRYLTLVSTQEKKSPHVLRHSYATTLLNHGADLNSIKELLGHASLAATQVYTHNSIERLKTVYKQAHPKA